MEKFEPTHVGCYEPEAVHGPNAFQKEMEAFHESPEYCRQDAGSTLLGALYLRTLPSAGLLDRHAASDYHKADIKCCAQP
jgi:hypothetical protein